MKFEDKMLWQLAFIAPNDPTDSRVDKTKFMTRGIDRLDTRKFKVPLICLAKDKYCFPMNLPFGTPNLGMGEGRDETP